ncbi:MAG: hypothetical protein GWP61_19120 [Chloroflexi bacterium]|jgi:hypothetical protein|nr:hypothetical protein [Chloroflexota bacterium]
MTSETTISGRSAPDNGLRCTAARIADRELWLLLLIVALVFVARFTALSYELVPALALMAITWL